MSGGRWMTPGCASSLYAATLKGLWKPQVGDYRLVCQITQRGGQTVLIIYVAHRSIAYGARGVRTVRNRDR